MAVREVTETQEIRVQKLNYNSIKSIKVTVKGKEIGIKRKVVYNIIKRFFDFLCSLIAIILLSPLLIFTAIGVKCTSKGPVFYTSYRVGKFGKPFKMYKFRSMYTDADERLDELLRYNETDGPTFKMKDDPRITPFGKFIRKTSIDELPQLFNILTGKMSIVGPRPALAREVEQYNDYDKVRLSVTPGLTCIWQCSGRSNVTFKEWMDMDIEYIGKRSLWFDFYLILKTIPAVLRGSGAE